MSLAAAALLVLAALVLAGWAWTELGARRATERERPEEPLVEADGLRVHLVERGPREADASRAPVVLVHGTDALLDDFTEAVDCEPLADAVGRRRRCVAVDRPGHGYSDPVPGDFRGASGDAETLRSACRALGVTRPIVVGHSYGAVVALRWALEAPETLRGLVLVSPATHPDRFFDLALHRLGARPWLGAPLRHVLLRPLGTALVPRMIEVAFDPATPPPRYVERMRGLALRPAQFAAHAREISSLNAQLAAQVESYPSLEVPVAVVAAEDDRLTRPDRHARRFARDVPSAHVVVLPRGGHEVHHVDSAPVLRAIDWVEDAADASASERRAE